MVSHKNYRNFFAFNRINHCGRNHFSQISSEKQSSVSENGITYKPLHLDGK